MMNAADGKIIPVLRKYSASTIVEHYGAELTKITSTAVVGRYATSFSRIC